MDGVICVNSRQAAWLSGYAGQARVIGNWLPAADRSDPSHQAALRDELGLRSDTLIVGCIGRLQESYAVHLVHFRMGARLVDRYLD